MQIDDCSVHFSYDGEASEVMKWLPHAKQTFRWVRKQGLTNHRKILAQGIELSIQYIPPRLGRIYIKVDTSNLISGLCSLHLEFVEGKYTVRKDTGVNLIQLRDTSTAGTEKSQLAATDTVKTKKPFLYKSFYNDSPSYAYNTDKVNQLVGGDINDIYPQSLNNSPFLKHPGMYTGEMRKVVQMALGMGLPIRVEYSFNRSNGIFKSSNGKRYLIEIGDRGILARPLNCTYLDNEQLEAYRTEIGNTNYDLPYKINKNTVLGITETDLEAAISSGSVIRVASADSLAGFYVNNSYFDACGWAFSSTGRAAGNTCWNNKPDGLPRWPYGYRYAIYLKEDINGIPTLSSIDIEDEGYLHGNVVSWWMPKDLTTLYHFDTWRQNIYGSPPTGPYGCGIYVYYDGEVPVVMGYLPDRNLSTESRSDSFDLDPTVGELGATIYNTYVEKIVGQRVSMTQQEVYVDTPANVETTRFYGNVATVNVEELSNYGVGCFPYAEDGSFFSTGFAGAIKGFKQSYLGANDVGNVRYSVGIIPAYDRECVLLYESSAFRIPSGTTYGFSTGYDLFIPIGYVRPSLFVRKGGTNDWAIQAIDDDYTVSYVSPSPSYQAKINGYSVNTEKSVFYPFPTGVVKAHVDPVDNDKYQTPSGGNFPAANPVAFQAMTLVDTDIMQNRVSSLTIYSSGNAPVHLDVTGNEAVLGDLTFLSIGSVQGEEQLWYESVVDAFTNSRAVSKADNTVRASEMQIIGSKIGEYSVGMEDSSYIKYFFGAP